MKSKSLTLRQAAGIVIVDAGFCLFFARQGYNALQAGDKVVELLCCVGASTEFLLLPFFVCNFFRVKKGIPVMVRHEPSPATPQVAFHNLCIMMGSLGTVAIVLATVDLFRNFYTIKNLEEKLVTIGMEIIFCLLYCLGWLWVLSQRPPPPLAAQEQPEGVWPPAPSMPGGATMIDEDLQ